MTETRQRRWTRTGSAVALFLLFSGLGFVSLATGVWLLLDQHEREFAHEVAMQVEFAEETIPKAESALCTAASEASKSWVSSLKVDFPLKATAFDTAKSYELALDEMKTKIAGREFREFVGVAPRPNTEKPSGKCESVEVSWLAVWGQPGELSNSIGSWSEEGFYTLTGFVKIEGGQIKGATMRDSLSQASPEQATDRWGVVFVEADRSVPGWSRLAGLIGSAGLSGVFLLVAVYILLGLSEPLRRLEAALNTLYGTMADRKEPSPAGILAKLQEFEPLVAPGTKRGQSAIQSFNAMHKQLREFTEYQGKLMAAMYHDLGTRIDALRFRIRRDWGNRDKRERPLEIVNQMDAMAEDALYLLTGEGAHEQYGKRDLSSLVEAVVSDIEEIGGNVQFNGGPAGLVVNARRHALWRAIDNLVRNALFHGGSAEVSLQKKGDMAIVEIADRGPGIPTHTQDGKPLDVTEPFVRGDSSRNTRTGGAGLGLTIARDNIRDHGGELSLLPREGGGTVARAVLPLLRGGGERAVDT